MKRLSMIGLGITNENSVSLEGLQRIMEAEVVFAEFFTSILEEGSLRRLGALTEKEIPARQSFSAGTYLCNHVMYESLYHVRTNGLDTLTGFIHMPLQNIIDIDEQIEAVKIMLDTVIDHLEGE